MEPVVVLDDAARLSSVVAAEINDGMDHPKPIQVPAGLYSRASDQIFALEAAGAR